MGLKQSAIKETLRRGWSVEMALTMPPHKGIGRVRNGVIVEEMRYAIAPKRERERMRTLKRAA